MVRNQFAVLGLMPGASGDEIKKAYRSLARQYHPDKNQHPSAEDKFKIICSAYEYLSCEDNRSTHERELRQNFERNHRSKQDRPENHSTFSTHDNPSSFSRDSKREHRERRYNFSDTGDSNRSTHEPNRTHHRRQYRFTNPEDFNDYVNKTKKEEHKKKYRSSEQNDTQENPYESKQHRRRPPRFDRQKYERTKSTPSHSDDTKRFIPGFFFEDFFSVFSEPFKSMERDFEPLFRGRDPFYMMHRMHFHDHVFDETFHDFHVFESEPMHPFGNIEDMMGDFQPFGNLGRHRQETHRRQKPSRREYFHGRGDPFRETI